MGIGHAGRLALAAIAALACAALLAPAGATAASVVNGNFETGTLQGWDVHRATGAGNWFAYRRPTEEEPTSGDPIAEKRGQAVPPPPQGRYAAIADEISTDGLILSQEVGLGAGLEHRLSLLVYYESLASIAVPAPETLSVDGEALAGQTNQQYRIDVMRPGSPIESVAPADILLTAFRAQPGDPRRLSPTRLTADLSAFAGQKVRLRIAVAATGDLLAGGVDDVAVESAPPGQLPPRKGSKPRGPNGASRVSFGRVKANSANGTAILPVKVPGPGRLSAKTASAGGKASVSKRRKPAKLIKPVNAKATRAGTVKLLLRPTDAARGILERKQRLRVRVAVTYKPKRGAASTATVPVVLKLVPRQRR